MHTLSSHRGFWLRHRSFALVSLGVLISATGPAVAAPSAITIDNQLRLHKSEPAQPLLRSRIKLGSDPHWRELGALNTGLNHAALGAPAGASARSAVIEVEQADRSWLAAGFQLQAGSDSVGLTLSEDAVDGLTVPVLKVDGQPYGMVRIRADQLDHVWNTDCFLPSDDVNDDGQQQITCHVESTPRYHFDGLGRGISNIGNNFGTLVADTDLADFSKDEIFFTVHTPPFHTTIYFDTQAATYSAWTTHILFPPYKGSGTGRFKQTPLMD